MIPDDNFRFIALDVETACRDAASICQIGLACVWPDNRIHSFSTLADDMQSSGHPIVIMGETDFKQVFSNAGVVK